MNWREQDVQKLRILVVDDEPLLQELLGIILESEYVVLKAGSVQEALDVSLTEEIDLLITDLSLPDGRGDDLMQEVKQRHAEIPTLIISGYSANALRADVSDQVEFLPKPFTAEEVAESARRLAQSSLRNTPLGGLESTFAGGREEAQFN